MLEAVRIRFLRIGGTSAGSITALLLAALDGLNQPKAEKLVEVLAGMDTWSFVDGGPPAQRSWSRLLDQAERIKLAFDGARVITGDLDEARLQSRREVCGLGSRASCAITASRRRPSFERIGRCRIRSERWERASRFWTRSRIPILALW